MHMDISFSPPDITEAEIEAVADTLRSGWITTGPKTKEFEKEIAAYCGTIRAAAFNSATAALEQTLRVLGIGPGDEVITTAYTYTATASCICHVGAKPVLVDTKAGSFDMDPAGVEAAVTAHTKAVICVDLAGIVYPYYDEIFRIAKDKKHLFSAKGAIQESLGRIAVLTDGAHAFGASRGGKMCGAIADFTCFSFHAVKNLTTAEGGAATWTIPYDTDEIYRNYMLLSLHGQSKDALAKTKAGQWEYDIVGPYYKCNMTDIMASIGLVQLSRYEGLLARRRELIGMYDAALKPFGVEVLTHASKGQRGSGHLYLTRIPGADGAVRNRFIEQMAARGIATNVHYKPLPLLTAYKNLGFRIEDYPQAYRMFTGEVTLPLHTLLSDEEADYVARSYKECLTC